MRRVASELDTGAASLYVYVANRDELLEEMFDRVIGEVPLEPVDPERWREQMHQLASSIVRVMDSYPGIARVAMHTIPTGANALRLIEAMLSYLRAGGIPDQNAAWAADIVSLYFTSIAFENSLWHERGKTPADLEQLIGHIHQVFATLPADRYPHTAALGLMMTIGDDRERFACGMDVLINGLIHTPPPTPTGQTGHLPAPWTP